MPPWCVKTGKSKTLIMYLYEIVLPSKRKVLRLTEETQPSCSTDCWSLSHLSASFFLFVCFTSLCCSFHPRCLYHQKEKKTHTRQELISPAANSHSRWSIFSPFQNERTEWKLWPYTWSSVKQSSWDCFQLQALYFVSVYFSAFIILYLPLFWSLHIQLSVYTRRRRCARWRAARGSIQSWITFASSGLVSPVWSFIPACLDLLFLFNMLYM